MACLCRLRRRGSQTEPKELTLTHLAGERLLQPEWLSSAFYCFQHALLIISRCNEIKGSKGATHSICSWMELMSEAGKGDEMQSYYMREKLENKKDENGWVGLRLVLKLRIQTWMRGLIRLWIGHLLLSVKRTVMFPGAPVEECGWKEKHRQWNNREKAGIAIE